MYDGNGNSDLQDDTINYVEQYGSSVSRPTFEVLSLAALATYQVQWFYTDRTNNPSGISNSNLISLGITNNETQLNANATGELTITAPYMTDATSHDYAFIISQYESSQEKKSGNFIDEDANSQLKVLPNPNNGKFQLELDNNEELAHVTVFNVMGKQVFVSTITGNQFSIDISDRGIYIVSVQMGDQILNKKIVKQ
ncbi:MAG: T9SS type A sorting domain-containing protein [Flavobacteriales bacterium]|nr:T9SS type A sorting domain-containing protein [Flavobacteriales bacterium]